MAMEEKNMVGNVIVIYSNKIQNKFQLVQQKQNQKRAIDDFLKKQQEWKEEEEQTAKETEQIRSIYADARYKIDCLKKQKEKEVCK